MLHFRSSTVLKELFEAALTRPSSGSRHKTWLSARRSCVGAASVDSRAASSPLKVLYAASHRPAPRAVTRIAPVRLYCVKTEGFVEEQRKKDGVDGGGDGDK